MIRRTLGPLHGASYPLAVRQDASLLRASFTRHVAMPRLPFATLRLLLAGRGLSPPSYQSCSAHGASLRSLAGRQASHSGRPPKPARGFGYPGSRCHGISGRPLDGQHRHAHRHWVIGSGSARNARLMRAPRAAGAEASSKAKMQSAKSKIPSSAGH